MIKNLTGGALIPYGPTFPAVAEAYDGALFYKSAGTDKGLYLFGFNQDGNETVVGEQVTQAWNVVVSNQLFVSKTGDTMSGPLAFTSTNNGTTFGTGEEGISFNNATTATNGRFGALRWTFGNQPTTISAQMDVLQGVSNNKGTIVFSTRGTVSGLTERVRIDENGITVNGATTWTSGNDGQGSGLDADLLDGFDSSYFTNASNLTSGTLNVARLPFMPVQQGGGINQGNNKLYIGYTAGRLLLTIDSTNFADTWPINVNGTAVSAATANFATTAGSANSVPWSGVTGFPSGNYVLRAGDSMTGTLNVGNANGHRVQVNGITLDWASNAVTAASVRGWGSVYAGGTGADGVGNAMLNSGSGANAGYVSFNGGNNVRTGYIGNGGNSGSDAGVINYVCGIHNFVGNMQANGNFSANVITGNQLTSNGNINAAASIAAGGTMSANIMTANGISSNGNITAAGNVTGYSSDARLKKNVKPIENAIEKVKAIGGYSYDWDMDKCRPVGFTPENLHEHGLLAQEVREVLPDAVTAAPFNADYLTVRYERIVALLSAAINEQQVQIESLKAELAKKADK